MGTWSIYRLDGDYAIYYLFYMSSLGEQPEKFPAGGRLAALVDAYGLEVP